MRKSELFGDNSNAKNDQQELAVGELQDRAMQEAEARLQMSDT